jgi:hypothetical protein
MDGNHPSMFLSAPKNCAFFSTPILAAHQKQFHPQFFDKSETVAFL